jgi:hypothetical protein
VRALDWDASNLKEGSPCNVRHNGWRKDSSITTPSPLRACTLHAKNVSEMRVAPMKSLVTKLALLSCISGFVLGGCSSTQSTAQNGYQQGQWRPGGAPPGQWGQPQGGQSGPPQYVPSPANLPPVPNDPINNLDLGWMRQRAASILAETEASLPPNRRARVDGIPLVNDDTPGEINA